MLEGAIAPLGAHYVLTAPRHRLPDGRNARARPGRGDERRAVLKVLGSISSRSARRSASRCPRWSAFDVPIEQATTPSLQALKAYTLGLEERRRGRELESIAFLQPGHRTRSEFAAAYATLSTVYGSLGEWRRSEEFARLAYEHRRPRQRARAPVHHLPVPRPGHRRPGAGGRHARTLEDEYPRDSRPANALALIHNRMGRYEQGEPKRRRRCAARRTTRSRCRTSRSRTGRSGRYDDARAGCGEGRGPRRRDVPDAPAALPARHAAGDGSRRSRCSGRGPSARVRHRVGAGGGRGLRRPDADAATCTSGRPTWRSRAGCAARRPATPHGSPGRRPCSIRPAPEAARVRRVLALIEGEATGPGSVPRFRAAAAYALAGHGRGAGRAHEGRGALPRSTWCGACSAPSPVARSRCTAGGRTRSPPSSRRGDRNRHAGRAGADLPARPRRCAAGDPRGRRRVRTDPGSSRVDPFTPLVPLAHLGTARANARWATSQPPARPTNALRHLAARPTPTCPAPAARAEYARLGHEPAGSRAAIAVQPAYLPLRTARTHRARRPHRDLPRARPPARRDVAVKVLRGEARARPGRSSGSSARRGSRRSSRTRTSAPSTTRATSRPAFLVCELLEGRALDELMAARRWAPSACSTSPSSSPTRWWPRTGAASCTAASSRRTCSSPRTATSSCWNSGAAARAAGRGAGGQPVGIDRVGQPAGGPPDAREYFHPYLSPEQVAGRRPDERSDIFATGALIYEMATGEAPFQRRHAAEIMEPIGSQEPTPPRTVNPATLPGARTDHRCGARGIPEKRYQSPSELYDDLRRARRTLETQSGVTPASVAPRGRRRAAAGVDRCPSSGSPRWPLGSGGPVTGRAPRPAAQHRPRRPPRQRHGRSRLRRDAARSGDGLPRQSPYLDVVSDERIDAALRMMGRSNRGTRMTHESPPNSASASSSRR
jgi:hypothetical protein